MAINIFQGGKTSRNTNTAANSTRAQAAREALTVPSETSNSGNVAVASKGTLGKVGNFIGNAAGVAAKFLPGVGGMVAKTLSNVLNDPEWWQSVPGDGLTLNSPLRVISTGDDVQVRPAICEFVSADHEYDQVANPANTIILPSEQMVTQYLMPQVRKVVNAIPLQAADAYTTVLESSATLYALWRQLKKFRFMLGHGQTYMPNMNDPAFPYFRTENSARLDAAINRVEEYLRSSVRLPHTLCEYLAWRYGRVYKSSDSAKASLQMYNVLPISAPIEVYEKFIADHMSRVSSTTATQQAASDLYNAYFNHDLMVEIRDDTQFTYDAKEFALRTNCDYGYLAALNESNNAVYLDSKLDNPTAFMASTVSTAGAALTGEVSVLFPVETIRFYLNVGATFPGTTSPANQILVGASEGDVTQTFTNTAALVRVADSEWFTFVAVQAIKTVDYDAANDFADYQSRMIRLLTMFTLCKACEVYNKDLRLSSVHAKDASYKYTFLTDVTAPAFDMAVVPDTTIAQEHVYAFANLVDISRQHSMSYKQAEKLVAKDAANLVDNLDVAAVASPKPSV